MRYITGALILGQVVHLPGDDRLQTELLLLLGEFAAISPFPQLHSRLQALVDLGGKIAQHLNEGIHGISGSEIGEHRATARHPGNTAIVHFFAGRDVPGSAWEGRAPAPPGSSAPAPRHSHPAGIHSHPGRVLLQRAGSCRSTALGATLGEHIFAPRGCSYHGLAPVGAPPSVRTWASTFSHPTRVLLPRLRSCRSTALGANGASTYSHPGRVLLPRFRSCRSTALGANRSQHIFAPEAGAPTPTPFM